MSLFSKALSNSTHSTAWDTVTLRNSQHNLECSSSFPLTLTKLLRRLEFPSSESLKRSFPNPAAEQAELKFLITGTCFTTLRIRENLQSSVRAILPKEALIENFKDFVHITHLLRFIMPLSPSSQILHFRFLPLIRVKLLLISCTEERC